MLKFDNFVKKKKKFDNTNKKDVQGEQEKYLHDSFWGSNIYIIIQQIKSYDIK